MSYSLMLSLLLMYVCNLYGQEKIIGTYKDLFGQKITLYQNGKFLYKWNFDLASSWSYGNWTVNNNVIQLEITKVYDTLELQNDTLVESLTEIPRRIKVSEYSPIYLLSGRQNRKLPPKELKFKNNKLIAINSKGKLEKKKIYGAFRNKKHRPWFIKT